MDIVCHPQIIGMFAATTRDLNVRNVEIDPEKRIKIGTSTKPGSPGTGAGSSQSLRGRVALARWRAPTDSCLGRHSTVGWFGWPIFSMFNFCEGVCFWNVWDQLGILATASSWIYSIQRSPQNHDFGISRLCSCFGIQFPVIYPLQKWQHSSRFGTIQKESLVPGPWSLLKKKSPCLKYPAYVSATQSGSDIKIPQTLQRIAAVVLDISQISSII